VPAGRQLLAVLSSGGNYGIAATPGFQGYMIAQCAFQYAHGFAFISDVGGTAALLAGAGIGLGLIDRREARRWAQAEDARGSRLFLMIRPGAMLVRMGVTECFELPRAQTPDDGPSPFDLP
jgi:hypothetical protein